MDKEQQKAIRKFNAWQDRKFAANAKKGIVFFRPDRFEQPTPRSSRDAWGETYIKDEHDRRQEKYIDWLLYLFVFAYISFLLFKDF